VTNYYYIKKVADDDVRLYLQCSVSGNSTLAVQGLSLYSDPQCQQPCSPPPAIAAGDVFSTSQGTCRIHLQPPSPSDGWTFQAKKKGSSNLYNPLVVDGDASTPASFSVVATASGYSDIVLDPAIRFRNSVMQQAGVPTAVMLASAYIDPPLAGAHGISLVLRIGSSDQLGSLVFDPNPHPLDEWGEPVGPSIYEALRYEVEAITGLHTDDARQRAVERLDCRGLQDAEVFLVRDDSANRWTLIYAPRTGGRIVVPMFRQ
jgi:hypothetical protein